MEPKPTENFIPSLKKHHHNVIRWWVVLCDNKDLTYLSCCQVCPGEHLQHSAQW